MRNKHLYPKQWRVLARACKERAGWICEHCAIAQGDERISKRGRPYKVVLQAAHKNHLDRGRDDAELLCLCFTCHARYDYFHDQRLKDIRLHSLKHKRLITPARIKRAGKRVKAHV